MELDKSVPWGFFDGATQNNSCGGGALIFLSETHFFELVVGLGEGSNNFTELMSLKLLIFVGEKGCINQIFFGDSMNVINWTKGTQHCRNIRTTNILTSIKEVLNSFVSFSCRHVYKNNNKEADKS